MRRRFNGPPEMTPPRLSAPGVASSRSGPGSGIAPVAILQERLDVTFYHGKMLYLDTEVF